jgi:hypothetical protein
MYNCEAGNNFTHECENIYLLKFKSVEQIYYEIEKLEDLRRKIPNYKNLINVLERFSGQENKIFEIKLNIIEQYNLRNYKYIQENPKSIQQNIYEGLLSKFSHINKLLKVTEISNEIIVNNELTPTDNLIEILYKLIIIRRKMSNKLNELILLSECQLKENYSDVLIEVNKKLELLYEKYLTLLN